MDIRKAILESNDRERAPVEVPEWGVTVYISAMSAEERDSWEQDMIRDRTKNVRARLVVRVMQDENGERIFEDKDAADLGRKSAAVLDRLFHAATTLNGLTNDDVEELAKNS